MPASEDVDWLTCAKYHECIGVRLPSGEGCWAHADEQDMDDALKRLGEDGRLDARGVTLTDDLLQRLLHAVPRDDQEHRLLTDAQFYRATFRSGARFPMA